MILHSDIGCEGHTVPSCGVRFRCEYPLERLKLGRGGSFPHVRYFRKIIIAERCSVVNDCRCCSEGGIR